MSPRYHRSLLSCIQTWPFCQRSSHFHTGKIWGDKNVNHYDTLGLEPGASLATIKKQFYALSKVYHPDCNRHNPEASNRFMKISEAYSVLGSPERRQLYDRDVHRTSSERLNQTQRGSYSSSGPLGSRPATGLSSRRSHFKGPPPSFFRNGGWGSQKAKRQAQAETTESASSKTGTSFHQADANMRGWTGLNEPSYIWGRDVPHFNREGHYQRQEQLEQRRQRKAQDDSANSNGDGNMLINFICVGGVISFAYLVPTILERHRLDKS